MSTKTHNRQTSEKGQTQKRVERESQQQDQTFLPRPTDALWRVTDAPPSAVRPADILALQSSVGNRAVQRLVEKVRPHPTGDRAVIQRHVDEDFLAGAVVQPAGGQEPRPALGDQRGVQGAAATLSPPVVRPSLTAQRPASANTLPGLASTWNVGSPAVEFSSPVSSLESNTRNRMEAIRGNGQEIPQSLRNKAESHLGADLSEVRIHAGGPADKLAKDLGAQGFTLGRDVFLTSEAAQKPPVVAHELQHTTENDQAQLHFWPDWPSTGRDSLAIYVPRLRGMLTGTGLPSGARLNRELRKLTRRTEIQPYSVLARNRIDVAAFFREYPGGRAGFVDELRARLRDMADAPHRRCNLRGLHGDTVRGRGNRQYFIEDVIEPLARVDAYFRGLDAPALAEAIYPTMGLAAEAEAARLEESTAAARQRNVDRRAFQTQQLGAWVRSWTAWFAGSGAGAPHASLSSWLLDRWLRLPGVSGATREIFQRRFGVVPDEDDGRYMRSFYVLPRHPTHPTRAGHGEVDGLFEHAYERVRANFLGPDVSGQRVGIPQALGSHYDGYQSYFLHARVRAMGGPPQLRPNVRTVIEDWHAILSRANPSRFFTIPGVPNVVTRIIGWWRWAQAVEEGRIVDDYVEDAGVIVGQATAMGFAIGPPPGQE